MIVERPKWITIHVERLSPEEKKRKWAAIKQDYPALAEHLNDPVIKQLKERFGATITRVSYLNATLPSDPKNPS